MTIGGSLLLIALGAILRYAVNVHVDIINLETTGLILMVVGCLGLVLGVYLLARGSAPEDMPPTRPY